MKANQELIKEMAYFILHGDEEMYDKIERKLESRNTYKYNKESEDES